MTDEFGRSSNSDKGSENTTARMMQSMSPLLYGGACKLARLSGERTDRTRSECALAATIQAVAALEAYINEQARIYLMMHPKHANSAVQVVMRMYTDHENARLKLRDKWREYPCLFGKPGFDKSREPFQSFSELVELRNSVIHYKPDEEEWGKPVSDKLGRAMRSRFGDLDDPERRYVWAQDPACAYWACQTARAMVFELARLLECGDAEVRSLEGRWPILDARSPE